MRLGWLELSLLLVSGASGAVMTARVRSAAPDPLAPMRAAAGAWSRIGSLVALGTTEQHGMTGAWRMVLDLRAPRLMRFADAGIVRTREVWNGRNHWRQRAEGGVHALNSPFARESAATDLWLAQRGFLRPNGGGAQLGPPERRSDGRDSFIVMRAIPSGGQPVDLWFGAADHLLARTVRRLNLDTETVRYSDYRNVRGSMLPFLITEGDGDPTSAETIRISSYAMNTARPADFAVPRRPDDASVAGGRTTVPLRFDGYVTVEAKINGRGPFEFILDTGGHDILSVDAAQALGLTPQGAGRSGGSGEGTVAEQYARVARVEIGGMTLRDQVFTIIPLSYATVEQGFRPPLAGILGLELFERFAMRIDYRGRTLTIAPLVRYVHRGPGLAVPIFFNDDEPLVRGRLDGHAGEFGIDTGNAGSLIVQGRWADREGLAAALRSGYELVGFGMGGGARNWASRVDLELAGLPLRHVIGRYQNDNAGAFASIVEAGNIGNQVMANFTVTFDYQRGVMWLEPVIGFSAPPFSRAGVTVTKDGPEAFKVVLVSTGSPAAEAGLRTGDEIRRVDGVPARQLSYADFGRIVRQAPGTSVGLEFVRGGESRTATMILRELLP